MLLKTGNKIIPIGKEPFAIVFADDEELQAFIAILMGMPKKEDSIRWFVNVPKGFFKDDEFNKWTELSEEEHLLMTRIKSDAKHH